MSAVEAAVVVERAGRRWDVVLNRPHRRNAVTAELIGGLRTALEDAEADESVGAVVVRGAGGCFCSGLDLRDGGPLDELSAAWADLHRFIARMDTPVVGALEKAAVNAGAALALACDLVVAGETSFLQVREAAMGMTPPVNVAWLVTRHSASLARRLTLTCDAVAGPELHRLGIAARCVPDDEVVSVARALTDDIASYPENAGARVTSMVDAAARASHTGIPGVLDAVWGRR